MLLESVAVRISIVGECVEEEKRVEVRSRSKASLKGGGQFTRMTKLCRV